MNRGLLTFVEAELPVMKPRCEKSNAFRGITGVVTQSLFVLILVGASLAAQQQQHTSPGAKTYKNNCVLCHGLDGSGHTALGKQLQVVDLRYRVPKISDVELHKSVHDGRGNMPSYSDQLSDQEIDQVIKYLHTLSKTSTR